MAAEPCRHPVEKRLGEVMADGRTRETCLRCGAQRWGRRKMYWSRFREPRVRLAQADAKE